MPTVRAAVRYPLQVPLYVYTHDLEQRTETRNVSTGGVLFSADREVAIGTRIRFTLIFSARATGSSQDVVLHCVGRVVRCSPEDGRSEVAAVIDDYKFVR